MGIMIEKLYFVVVGNGMVGCCVVEEILICDVNKFCIIIFGVELCVNYNCIMLLFLFVGEKLFDDIVINDQVWYDDNVVVLVVGDLVVVIDCKIQIVIVCLGCVESYDKFIFVIGFDLFIILVLGYDLQGVVMFCDMDDVGVMLWVVDVGGDVVVIGGGLFGLEVVYGFSLCGMKVMVLYIMLMLMEW